MQHNREKSKFAKQARGQADRQINAGQHAEKGREVPRGKGREVTQQTEIDRIAWSIGRSEFVVKGGKLKDESEKLQSRAE